MVAPTYKRHSPKKTLLYQLVKQYCPIFVPQLAAEGTVLPDYVHQESEAYFKCGRLEHGFLRARCDGRHAELAYAVDMKTLDSLVNEIGCSVTTYKPRFEFTPQGR